MERDVTKETNFEDNLLNDQPRMSLLNSKRYILKNYLIKAKKWKGKTYM